MKVYFKTVGCRVNQVETQSLAEKFSALGHQAADGITDADLLIINSCTVTDRADRDTLNFIRKAAAANPKARLVVTGCLATLDPKKILELAPAASLFSNKDKETIPYALSGRPPKRDFFSVRKFSGRTRAFIKLQDGCDLGCGYCLVPLARNEISSKDSAAAVNEIKNLIAGGFREIVLCGTRLGMYKCPATGRGLAGLMKEIFKLDGDFRIRFSSLEPMEISQSLLEILQAGGGRFCDYVHLPLQSGSDETLRAMGRPYDTAGYSEKLRLLRKYFKDPGLYADVITGYPGETEARFRETMAFIRGCGLAGLHIFSFSKRPGTRAYALKALSPAVIKERSARLHELDRELRAVFAASMCGRTLKTLTLKNKDGFALGLASNFLNVAFNGALKSGIFVNARITGAAGGTCAGEAAV
ncbi:MAG: MiaB/RimO family radical SAM methylthiotransferase [Elusimicrobia bacterium]|nr:MiaB/RimO family radical SAM methylthiotransferase [Elusimicrobiota bacterium]